MNTLRNHPWQLSYQEARNIQNELRKFLVFDYDDTTPETVAGVDVSYSKTTNRMYAAVLVLEFDSMRVIAEGTSVQEARYPYIPGLLSFREGPSVDEAYAALDITPDVILFDGHGIAHPRRLGLAAHLGIRWNIPTIGCAKKKLVGEFIMPEVSRGATSPLTLNGETIGTVVRTRHHVKPMFVSPGYRTTLETAVAITLACGRGYRLPEPTRLAHHRVNALRLSMES